MRGALEHLQSLGFSPNLIIDVGVATGTPALQDTFPNARFLWIEPLTEFEDSLLELSRRFRGRYVLAAAGRSAGTFTMGVGSTSTGKLSTSSFFRQGRATADREVKVIRLDDCDEARETSSDGLLKVDVEGAELDVLDGAPLLLDAVCEVVILEVSLFGRQKGMPTFYDVVDYMKKRDYVVYDVFDRKSRRYDRALGQIDLLFVRETGRFRKTQQWA